MAIGVRRIRPDEVEAFVASVGVPFFETGNDDEAADFTLHVEPARAWVAVDGDRFVGNACTLSRDVTLPAAPGGECPVVPFAGVSGVGVHPTHRRRGLLTQMMAAVADDARERGEAFAALEASESSIYGRYGFGAASWGASTLVRTERSRFLSPAPPVELTLLDPAEAAKTLPALHDRLRRRRPGEVSRNDAFWGAFFADRPSGRHGASALYHVAGDGCYVAYRAKEISEGSLHAARLHVADLYAASDDLEAALWRFLFDVDLVSEVTARRRPLDDPLRWRLAEPRQLQVTEVRDLLWVRILDVAAAFTARGYEEGGRLVLGVHGGDPDVAGTWQLDADPEGSACRRVAGADPDVELGISELGAVFLGGVRPSALAAGGRATEGRVGGLRRADHILAAHPGPTSGTLF